MKEQLNNSKTWYDAMMRRIRLTCTCFPHVLVLMNGEQIEKLKSNSVHLLMQIMSFFI